MTHMVRLLLVMCGFVAGAALAEPPITRADFDDHIVRLGLSDVSDIARATEAYEAYVAAIQEIDLVSDAFYGWSNGRDASLAVGEFAEVCTRDGRRYSVQRAEESSRVERRYFERLESAFPDKSGAVAWLVRATRRDRQLARDGHDLGHPNLIRFIEAAVPDAYQRADVKVILDEYDLAIDSHLKDVAEWFTTDDRVRIDECVAQGDVDGAAELYERWLVPQARQRELTLRYLARLIAALMEAEGNEFRNRVDSRVYRDILEPTRVDILLANARSRENLSEGQRSRLDALEAALESRRASDRRRLMGEEDELESVEVQREYARQIALVRCGLAESSALPRMLAHHQAVRAYRAIGSEYEEEISRILADDGDES